MSAQYYLADAPSDIISSLRFSPSARHSSFLLASSWDSSLRLYDVAGSSHGNGSLLTRFDTEQPILDCTWDRDGRRAYIGGVDGVLRMVDLECHETTDADALHIHASAITSIVQHDYTNAVVTGSWDRTLHVHDTRTHATRADISLPHKVFSMDATRDGYMLVVGMAARAVFVYDLRNMAEPFQRRESSLKYMTRTVRCILTGEGYASSSIEGRIAVDFFDPTPAAQTQKYAFKCHRATTPAHDTVYPVNALSFHPTFGTFVSGGSDALVCFWDYRARKRLRQYPAMPGAVQALEFDISGSMLAVAYGGDVDLGRDGDAAGTGADTCGIAVRVLAPGEGKSKA
ncbi:WD40-repeat-containing domain protein [Limtongia smithiae]|uniref:WD40-repeat-containing domain protein n=1 Tax=Limtongia smithiae TaxID=1125753 RepID=UPI0034CE53CB